MCLSVILFFFLRHRSATHADDLPTCDETCILRNVSISRFLLFLHPSDPSFSSIAHRVHVFQQLNLRPSPLYHPFIAHQILCLTHSACPCLHQAFQGATGHFSASPKNCTLLSTESHCTHDPLSPALFLLFWPLLQRKNEKNTFPICGTPWRHISRSELHQKCLVLLHSGSCLLLSWRRKNGPFSAHKLLAQDSCPSPSPARRGASGPPWCYLGSSGFFWFRFFDFYMSERFKKKI